MVTRYTTQETPSGTFEVLDEGKRIGTGSKSFADSYTAQNAPQESAADMAKRVANQGKTGFDVFGNPVAGATPITRYTSAEDAGVAKPGAFSQADADRIREQTAQEMAARIQGVESMYGKLIGAEQQAGADRAGRTRAIGARGGLQGSPRGDAQKQKTADFNTSLIQNLEAQKAAEIGEIYTRIDSRADERIAAERSRLEGEAEKYNAYLAKNREQALADLKVLGSAGYSLEDLDPADIEDLLADTGFGSKVLLEAHMNANRPKELQTDYQYRYDEGTGKIIAYGVDPKTGKLSTMEEEVGVPKPTANSKLQTFPDGRLAWVDEGAKSFEFIDGINVSKPQPGSESRTLDTGGFEFGTPEYTSAAIKDSARYGDKRLLTDERKNITASKRALGMLETYNKIADGTLGSKESKEFFGEGTGVIKGRLRTLASQWGGDANAAALNATIQGIIPTIARGIFQEVGVLTDQDIANYRRTVPDINKPENANKLIELVLLNTLEKAYADTLLTAAQNQTNVSNFSAEYDNVLDRIKKLGGGSQPGLRATGPDGTSYDFDELSDEERATLTEEGYVFN